MGMSYHGRVVRPEKPVCPARGRLSGQTATEYVLILALLTILIIFSLIFIGDDINAFWSKLHSKYAEATGID